MRKIFLFFIIPSLIFLIGIPHFFSVNAACQGLPPIPVEITPTEGDFNTNYTVTIKWKEIETTEFARYENINVHLGLFDTQGKSISAGTDNIDNYYGRQQENSNHILNNLLLSAGTHQLNLHLSPQFGAGKNFSCVFEEESPSITVTSTYDPNNPTTSTLKAGDPCNPQLQSDPQFSCPEKSSCKPVGATYNGKWICKNNLAGTSSSPPCATKDADGKCIAVDTAIGQISTDPKTFVQSIFSIVLGLAGGIALILIMYSGYKMMASQGNPEALTAARDQLISAIVGLLFIIFSFVILQVIGVDILRIPGFAQ